MRTVSGRRWDCNACGACCTVFRLGPLTAEDRRRLELADMARRWPPAAEGFLVHTPEGWFLRQVEGACVFLMRDRRCAVWVHAHPDLRPTFCRRYPLDGVEDARGGAVGVRPSCAGAYAAARHGRPLVEHLRAGLPGAVPRWDPPTVVLVGDRSVPTRAWLDREDALLDRLAAPGSAAGLVARLREAIVPGSPAPTAERYELALAAVFQAWSLVLGHALRTPDSPEAAAFARALVGALEAARSVEAAPAWDLPARRHASRLARDWLLVKGFRSHATVAAGAGAWLADLELAARAAAGGWTAPEGQAPDGPDLAAPAGVVTGPRLAAIHRRWVRMTDNPTTRAVLRRARPALEDLFLHAGRDRAYQ